MSDLSRPTDRELDWLLAGKPPAEDSQLEELAAFIHDVRACFAAEPPAGPVAAQHLAMIAETAALLAEGADAEQGVARGSSDAGRPVSHHHGWRRKPMFKFLLPALSGKAAASVAAGVLLVFGFSASAYAGVLPNPVQNAVSSFADNVGLPSVPSADPADAQTNDNNADNNVDEGRVGDDATQVNDNSGDNNNVDEGQVSDDATQVNDNSGDNNNIDDGQVGEDTTQANDNNGDNNNVDEGQVGDDATQANDSNDQAPPDPASPTPSGDQGGGNTSGGDQGGQGDQGH